MNVDLIAMWNTSRMLLRIVVRAHAERSGGRRAKRSSELFTSSVEYRRGLESLRASAQCARSGGLRESADGSEGRRTCRRVTLAGRAQKRRFRRRTDPLGREGEGSEGSLPGRTRWLTNRVTCAGPVGSRSCDDAVIASLKIDRSATRFSVLLVRASRSLTARRVSL